MKEVTYERLKKTGSYENERASVTLPVEAGQSVDDALREAKAIVHRFLGLGPSKDEVEAAKKLIDEANALVPRPRVNTTIATYSPILPDFMESTF